MKFEFNKPYLLVIFHPVTTEFGGIENQTEILANTIDDLNFNTIWLWPNVDAGTDKISKILRKFREKNKLTKVTFFKNFDNDEYITLKIAHAIEIAVVLSEKDFLLDFQL